MLKVSIFYYCLTCHGHEWACSKEKNVFHFLIKVKTANQCFLTAYNVLIIKKRETKQQQTNKEKPKKK